MARPRAALPTEVWIELEYREMRHRGRIGTVLRGHVAVSVHLTPRVLTRLRIEGQGDHFRFSNAEELDFGVLANGGTAVSGRVYLGEGDRRPIGPAELFEAYVVEPGDRLRIAPGGLRGEAVRVAV